MTRNKMKFKCPCCGFLTFNHIPDGSYDICPVCFWEDDIIQLNEPDYEGGANHVSLIQARKNFITFGACEDKIIRYVRKPRKDEIDK